MTLANPIRFVDSHCHLDRLDLKPFDGKLESALAAARNVGVEYFLCVAINLEAIPYLAAIAEQFPGVYTSVGIHPGEKVTREPNVEELVALANNSHVVAIGETGLDYHYLNSNPLLQQERFRKHIQAAHSVQKPLIIHSRDARADTLQILREERARDIGGVMHCFTEDWNTAHAALDLGFYISFSGIITFNNATELQKIAQRIPLEYLLIETDAPYLTPVPFRGKAKNQPAWVKYVAEKIAAIHEIELATVATATTENFFRFIKKQPVR